MTPEQSRAARALLDWPQARLGGRSHLSEGTIRDFEKGRRIPPIAKLVALRVALEMAGVVFLADGETACGGPGVRLKKSHASAIPFLNGEAGTIEKNEM
ncbi:helix-turn-helix transcriptional regulator (plasmid) [Mesorhizobium sp. AR02]|nr:helix-turn-helix transcriptional regulator [Mesorhizobium sp. AR02]